MKKEPVRNPLSPLALGGHSFIPELGNDAQTTFENQLAIVNECLEQGINCFDTTYEPERIALGLILEALGRRSEAHIIAWNFFIDIRTEQYLVGPKPFEPQHIGLLLQQLRTDTIDMLVVHPVNDDLKDQKQVEVAQSWVASGLVGRLGTWAPGNDPAERFGKNNPFSFAVMPRNIKEPNTESLLACKELGWQTFGTSPFNRGWLLDQLDLVEAEWALEDPETSRAKVADGLLRFSFHEPYVDHLIVGLRKKEWIDHNLDSIRKGPLSEAERSWLFELLKRA